MQAGLEAGVPAPWSLPCTLYIVKHLSYLHWLPSPGTMLGVLRPRDLSPADVFPGVRDRLDRTKLTLAPEGDPEPALQDTEDLTWEATRKPQCPETGPREA